VYSRKAHTLAIMLKPTPSGLTLRNACILGSVRWFSSQYPVVTWDDLISLAASERPTCVLVIRPMCARFSLISHSSCLMALTDVGNVHMRDPSSSSSRDCFPMCLVRSLPMPWCTAILGFCKAYSSLVCALGIQQRQVDSDGGPCIACTLRILAIPIS